MPFKSNILWLNEVENILKMGSEYKTLREIGEHYGVTKKRIEQILKKLNIDKTLIGKKKQTVDKEAKWKLKWGNKNGSAIYHEQRHKFRMKKANCVRNGVKWNIEFGEIDWPTHCPMLGNELDYFNIGHKDKWPTFDKIVPSKGYVKGNVQIISWRANRIKNDATPAELLKIAEYMKQYAHLF